MKAFLWFVLTQTACAQDIERRAEKRAQELREAWKESDDAREAEEKWKLRESIVARLLQKNPSMPRPAAPLPPFNPRRHRPPQTIIVKGWSRERSPVQGAADRTAPDREKTDSKPLEDEPAAKRHVTGVDRPDVKGGLLPACKIGIRILVEKMEKYKELNCGGQTLELKDLALTITVKDIKEKLQPLLGNLPTNKQKISRTGAGVSTVLKDDSTLASLSFVDGETLRVGYEERGKVNSIIVS